ncbi:alanine--tRNA ligase [Reichenbachiella carrageenanivorans]|uniref:Alanine--tRNA ligase n=1 Tax=Reichenbachiella carrageenanivorans TaxID=2979869 RepID=A0ABY6D0S7_9BACT|nr:alanine--tRNA ligase [Reichenbachiella carrageenanivorans]UXX79309.1 alanine--tRNA ligase [Reichenbachiella carrageenanivorans]
MESKEIRKRFLAFFEKKQHEIVASAPMVIQNDPTLMFTNAGMNQFKDFFLGNAEPSSNRIADTQKCLRVSGKHNDLEEVGMDTYHHTMFEMLGNWSFGDYFKKEAIQWAWELLTVEFELPADRMYASVFGGDEADGLEMDQEAYDFWAAIIPEDRIINGSKKDNFWEMGDTGPCGPCSEIHIDLRSDEEVAQTPGKDLVNMDHPQVVEVWNLVFMQFNRLSNGSLQNLPAQHVDTGMGFERLAMAVQGKQSNYDTDVFTPLINFLADAANVKYGEDEKADIALRVIADHVRAISFAIADGQLPSNNKAGYVIRRILRRAVRYGYTFLDFKAPFIHTLVPLLAEQFDGVFPELIAQKDFITKVIMEEESSFLRTLDKGLSKLEVITAEVKKGTKIIDGKTVFELYDTYGFPFDLTSLIARENNLSVDEEGFKKEMEIQKNRSKKAAETSAGDWVELKPIEEVQFLGYESLASKAQIVKYQAIEEKGKKLFKIVLDQTPFYAESGGQVGDTGYIADGDKKISILDTKKENNLIIHFTNELPANLEAEFDAVVNGKRRKLTENNHSATHLLHAALRQVLGTHVQQKGSLVNEKSLRFDFSHFSKMTDEEIAQVEKIVNQKIRENIALDEKRNVPIADAQALGAMALFGEKYGDFVRVITFDKDYSVELCGGTHVPATGTIGLLKIVSEGSVAAGVRRIEAITADKAEEYYNKQNELITQVNELLNNPKDPLKAIEALVKEKQELAKVIESINQEKAGAQKAILQKAIQSVNGYNVLISEAQLPDTDGLKKLSFELKNEVDNLIMIVAADIAGKPQISIMIAEGLVKSLDLHAGQLIKELAKEIKGGGGGQPFYATAGGQDLSGLPNVITKAKAIIDGITNH